MKDSTIRKHSACPLFRHTPVLTNASEDDETPWKSRNIILIITSSNFVHKLDCEYIKCMWMCLFLTLCSSADWVCCLRRALRGPASFPALPPLPIPVHEGEKRNLGEIKDSTTHHIPYTSTNFWVLHLIIYCAVVCGCQSRKLTCIQEYSNNYRYIRPFENRVFTRIPQYGTYVHLKMV